MTSLGRSQVLNVLLTSAGRRVELLELIRTDLRHIGCDGRVLVSDASSTAPVAHLADAFLHVPRVDDPSYVAALQEAVIKHRIGLVIPTIDTELTLLARLIDDLAHLNVHVLGCGPETVATCADKTATHRHLRASGLPCPRQWATESALEDAATLPYPVIVKPTHGSASHGVARVESADELRVALSASGRLTETVAPGSEYTVDVWVDRAGQVRSVVPRRRLEVRGGEVSKAVTVMHQAVIDAATQTANSLPDAYGPLTIQMFADGDQVQIIEVNARFGGGYPLAWKAGARTTLWGLQDALGIPNAPESLPWQSDLMMLRYDRSVFIAREELQG